ncbi:hypothetical protein, partial [Streptomyces niveus]|uniref:hypothetical protein n=2 Tax=Streptomyces niveus TaxID=193462 RepID=UPI0034478D7C
IHETVNQVGVSTYLALTFGTLLSSQGTDASFVPVSGPSGLPFGLTFQTVSGLFAFPDHPFRRHAEAVVRESL